MLSIVHRIGISFSESSEQAKIERVKPRSSESSQDRVKIENVTTAFGSTGIGSTRTSPWVAGFEEENLKRKNEFRASNDSSCVSGAVNATGSPVVGQGLSVCPDFLVH